jgi:hypothetical protein
VDQLLAGTPACADFRSELAPALAFHGRYIERYLSTYFSPNTHLLGEAVALFFLGTLYPQMPRAARWKESGWQIVLREAGRQVRPDGVYFEQSLYYHVYALDFFLYARLLAARNGMEIPPAYDAVVGRMLDVVAALAQSGPAEGFGDDDGGRLWNPRRNRTEQMTDPLALGAVMYCKEFSAARPTAAFTCSRIRSRMRRRWLWTPVRRAWAARATGMPTHSACGSPWMDGAGWWTLAPDSTFRKTPRTGTRFVARLRTTQCAWMEWTRRLRMNLSHGLTFRQHTRKTGS